MKKYFSKAIEVLGILIAGFMQGSWYTQGYYNDVTVGEAFLALLYTAVIVVIFKIVSRCLD